MEQENNSDNQNEDNQKQKVYEYTYKKKYIGKDGEEKERTINMRKVYERRNGTRGRKKEEATDYKNNIRRKIVKLKLKELELLDKYIDEITKKDEN